MKLRRCSKVKVCDVGCEIKEFRNSGIADLGLTNRNK